MWNTKPISCISNGDNVFDKRLHIYRWWKHRIWVIFNSSWMTNCFGAGEQARGFLFCSTYWTSLFMFSSAMLKQLSRDKVVTMLSVFCCEQRPSSYLDEEILELSYSIHTLDIHVHMNIIERGNYHFSWNDLWWFQTTNHTKMFALPVEVEYIEQRSKIQLEEHIDWLVKCSACLITRTTVDRDCMESSSIECCMENWNLFENYWTSSIWVFTLLFKQMTFARRRD